MLTTAKLLKRFQVADGAKFRLKDVDPADTLGLESEFKDDAPKLLARGIQRLRDLQEKLYAQDRWAVLLIFQAMDAAGKDSTIKHVMSGVNPQGVEVTSFKQPSSEDLDHDYLWRCMRRTPERGRIGIFNRSYYEEVLVVRVHPEILAGQRLPAPLVGEAIWEHRFTDINAYERYLTRNGVAIRKFFLHVSPEEQRKRFLERLEMPEKNWKFSLADVHERQHWKEYMRAYEDMIAPPRPRRPRGSSCPRTTSGSRGFAVAAVAVDALEHRPALPEGGRAARAELRAARRLSSASELLPARRSAQPGDSARRCRSNSGGRRSPNLAKNSPSDVASCFLGGIDRQQLAHRLGRDVEPGGVEGARSRHGPMADLTASPVPAHRSAAQRSTPEVLAEAGQRNFPSGPWRNQLTWKMQAAARAVGRAGASAPSSRPCCSRRRAASPWDRAAPRRRRRSAPPWSRTPRRPRRRRHAPSRAPRTRAARPAPGGRRTGTR